MPATLHGSTLLLLACCGGCLAQPPVWSPPRGTQQEPLESPPSAREEYSLTNPEPLEGNIFTGRPSFGVGTGAVPIGRFQIESGYTFGQDRGNDTHTVPTTLFRTGLTPISEFRVSTAGLTFPEGNEADFNDVTVGVRFETLQQDGLIPTLSIQPEVSLPVGDRPGSDSFNPGLVVPMRWFLSDTTNILANVITNLRTPDATRDTEVDLAGSILVNQSIDDRFSAFAEYFVQTFGGAKDQQSVDFGATWLWTANFQLDSAIGFGVNDAAPDFFITAGIAFRL